MQYFVTYYLNSVLLMTLSKRNCLLTTFTNRDVMQPAAEIRFCQMRIL